MSSIIYKFKFILTLITFLTPVCTELTAGGPHNVVGYFTASVTLHCNRDAPGGVTWRYIPPGSDLDQPIPGRHSYTMSSYGEHSLRLENLQRSDAGLYVCRSDRDPQSFRPASAFVVVVAQQPVCRANYTKFIDEDRFTVSCLVTYNGLLNLTLSVFRSDDNYTVVTRNYTSEVGGSWWKLDREVAANSSGQYVCRAKFYSSKTDRDVAKNRPAYIEAPCEPSPPEYAAETHSDRNPRARTTTGTTSATVGISNHTTADGNQHNTPSIFYKTENNGVKTNIDRTTAGGNSSAHVAISMSAIALSLVLVLIVLGVVLLILRRRRLKKQKRARHTTDGQVQLVNRNPTISEHRHDGGQTEPMLHDETALNLSSNSSARNGNNSTHDSPSRFHVCTKKNDAEAEHGAGPSDVQPSSASTSSSDLSTHAEVSLHDDFSDDNNEEEDEDDSNQNTVVPTAGRKLAQEFVAAAVLNN